MVVYELNKATLGSLPRWFGANIEVFDYADKSNQWDWIHHSGSKALRVLHPEVHLRREGCDFSRFHAVSDEAGFEAFRQGLNADPDSLPWGDYRFAERVDWLGVPDDIVDRCLSEGFVPIASIGYMSQYFDKPIISDEGYDVEDPWAYLDWSAAASAYEYHFAEFYRFIKRGVRWFSLHNEPDMYTEQAHLPADLEPHREEYFIATSFKQDGALYDRFMRVVGVQAGLMARIARMALDDAKKLLAEELSSQPVRFLGGVSPFADLFWPHVAPYVDVIDHHAYGAEPEEFQRKVGRILDAAERAEKMASFTEFGLKGGPTLPEEFMFSVSRSLTLAHVFRGILAMGANRNNALDLMTFYLLAGPSTHRNYKHLLYGDMNLLDWNSGQDRALMSKDLAWYPTFDELEIRHATPAYSIFRMFARLISSGEEAAEIVDADFTQPIHEKTEGLTGFTTLTDDRVIITVLNDLDENRVVITDLTKWAGEFKYGVVRVTNRALRDQCTEHRALQDARFSFDVPPESMAQLILLPEDLSQIESLRVEEVTSTPGSSGSLELYQTARLKALASLGGEEVDVTNLNVVFESENEDLVTVHQGGLVQRVRGDASAKVKVTASISGDLKDCLEF